MGLYTFTQQWILIALSLEISILLTVEDFDIIQKWASRVKDPTKKEQNVLKKLEFITEYLESEDTDE